MPIYNKILKFFFVFRIIKKDILHLFLQNFILVYHLYFFSIFYFSSLNGQLTRVCTNL